MKDLNTLDYIKELIEAGVTSLKIEGRMKSPEYVYTVTKLYRIAIDSYYKTGKIVINNEELDNLKKIFNREFTKGYLFNEKQENIINDKRPNHQGILTGRVIDYKNGMVDIKLCNNVHINDGLRIILSNEDYGIVLNEFYINKKLVKEAKANDIISLKVNKTITKNSNVLLTKDSKLIEKIDKCINEKQRKVLIKGQVTLKLNEPMMINISDGINEVNVIGEVINKAINNKTEKSTILEKITKLGETVYAFDKIDINIDDNVFIPLKLFNDLRRKAITLLNEKRLYKYEFIKNDYTINVPNFLKEHKNSVLVNNTKNINIEDYDIIYSETKEDNVITKLPKIMNNYDNYDIKLANWYIIKAK